MKSVMMSCSPRECCNILNYIQSILVRKKFPKDYKGWVYIYCTKEDSLIKLQERYKDRYICEQEFRCDDFPKMYSDYEGKGKVVARFYCDKVEEISCYSKGCYPYPYSTDTLLSNELEKKSCLTNKELEDYLGIKDCSVGIVGYAIHISQLEIFDKPRELSEFNKYGCKDYDKDVCEVYGSSGHLYTNCFFHLTKAPQSYKWIEAEE